LPFKFFNFGIYSAQTALGLADDGGDVCSLRGIDFRHYPCLFVEEGTAVIGTIRDYLAVTVAVAAKHLGISHLLALDGAIDFRLEAVGSHHIPGAAPLGGIPQSLELEEGFILEVAGLIKDDDWVLEAAQVIHEVIIHIRIPASAVDAEFGSYFTDQLEFGLDLRTVDIDRIPVGLDIVAGGIGLADVR
jgi:hypothetical protein